MDNENAGKTNNEQPMGKKIVSLAFLFIVVVTGAFAVKVGFEDGYFKSLMEKWNFQNQANVNLPVDKLEDITIPDEIDKTTAPEDNQEEINIPPVNEIATSMPARKPVVKPTLAQIEAQVTKITIQAQVISLEAQKLSELQQIQQQIDSISGSIKELSQKVSEFKTQGI